MQQFEAEEMGSRIKQARKEKGLTQEELAEMSSVSKRSLQDYENGVTLPYRHLRELGRLLGKDVEWFLHGDETEEAENNDELAAIREELAAIRTQLEAVIAAQPQLDQLLELARTLEASLRERSSTG